MKAGTYHQPHAYATKIRAFGPIVPQERQRPVPIQMEAEQALSDYVGRLISGQTLAFSAESRELAERAIAWQKKRGALDESYAERLAAEAADIRD